MRYPNRNQICALCQEEELKAQQIQRETELENRRNRVRSTFSLKSAKTPNIHDLTLEDAVYLLSFIRIAASEDLTVFGPVENAVERLSPTSDYSVEIIKHLMAKNLIFVHPDSSPDVFDFEEEGVTYSVNKVLYVLPTSNDSEETSRFITQLQGTFRTREWWPYKWHEEKLFLWRKVALHECLEYMGYVLNKHQMPFKPGDKTRLTLDNLLEQYSVAQIYTMIWSSGERAAAFFQRGNVTRQHAANTIIGKIEGYGERAIAQEWVIKHGRRDFNCPQSMVSRVLFDTVFKIGDKGFNEPPRVFDLEDVNSDADEDNPSSETSTIVAT